MTTELDLDEALAAREKFLLEHPHLRDYQEEVDRLLDSAGPDANRVAVLGTLMQGKLLELKEQMKLLLKEVGHGTTE